MATVRGRGFEFLDSVDMIEFGRCIHTVFVLTFACDCIVVALFLSSHGLGTSRKLHCNIELTADELEATSGLALPSKVVAWAIRLFVTAYCRHSREIADRLFACCRCTVSSKQKQSTRMF